MSPAKKSTRPASASVNLNKMQKQFDKSKTKAEKLMKDSEEAKRTMNEAQKKAEKMHRSGKLGPIEQMWESITLMFGVTIDYFNGTYREIPVGSIVAIVAALVYFLSPIDIIPDFIPVVGYLDDAFIIGLALAQVNADLQKYKAWKQKKGGKNA